jgi:hypothetical protein
MGRGVIKGDNGRRLFFGGAGDLECVAGLRVVYEAGLPPKGGPVEASSLGLESGVRTVLDPEEYLPQPKTKKKKKAPAKKKKAPAKKKAKTPPKLKKKAGESMAEGTPVSHKDFGAGHVLSSTKKFVRVKFFDGEERSLPFADLEDVGGKRGKPAPTRKKRAPAAKPKTAAGRSHVTRKKSEDE